MRGDPRTSDAPGSTPTSSAATAPVEPFAATVPRGRAGPVEVPLASITCGLPEPASPPASPVALETSGSPADPPADRALGAGRLAAAMAKTLERAAVARRWSGTVSPEEPLACGLDLGTASVVLIVLDPLGRPVACAEEPCLLVRDELVLDCAGAARVVRRVVRRLGERVGATLRTAALAAPPGTPAAVVDGHRHIAEAAGLEVRAVFDEPNAANAVLGLENGVIVDLGGVRTGLSVVEDSRVVATADEPTGGAHMTLVLMGRLGLGFEAAEAYKTDPAHRREVAGTVRPVAEKMAAVVAERLAGHQPGPVWLVGGTACLDGIGDVFADRLGTAVFVPPHPALVTPLGIALSLYRTTDKEGSTR